MAAIPLASMRLLFITQKLHEQDAFAQLWVREFIRQGFAVTVLCLEDRVSSRGGEAALRHAALDFPIYSLGKERGRGKIGQILTFWKLILTLRYDRVFIHMSPLWGMLGSFWWVLTGTPVYLWYTHYTFSVPMRMTGLYARRLFCATSQSLPQYEGSPKKVVVGHGIDLAVWKKLPNVARDPHALLAVHRLSRSKRLELVLRALPLLPESYTLTVYGIEAEPDYVSELKKLTADLCLKHRVTFRGTTPMSTLPDIYAHHRLILNMASETIDKTMLEAMTCGCYPVTTKRNAQAIGLSNAPSDDTPEAIAEFVRNYHPADPETLYRVVSEWHSLEGLVRKMGTYIEEGI